MFCCDIYTWLQVEEEALISSGSSEKQDDNLAKTGDSNSTGGVSGNTNAGSKKAVCSKVNTSEPVQDVEVIFFPVLQHCESGNCAKYFIMCLLYQHSIVLLNLEKNSTILSSSENV